MKKLNPVEISIEGAPDIDADDMGQRLVECISAMSTDNDVVNIVKIHVGDRVSAYNLEKLLRAAIIDPLTEMGATNCIFIPLQQGFIEDVTIDHIEVIKDDSDS